MLRSRQLISGLYELTELPTLIHSKKMDEKKNFYPKKQTLQNTALSPIPLPESTNLGSRVDTVRVF